MNLFADNQIAIYTVDTSAITTYESYAPPGNTGSSGAQPTNSPMEPPSASPSNSNHGASLTYRGFFTQDAIAQATGGEAMYSSNDLVNSLDKVTEEGGSYYTLSYSSTNEDFNRQLRQIRVKLKESGYHLSYRRAYYALPDQAEKQPAVNPFAAIMYHGAPEVHQLVFAVHIKAGSQDPGREQKSVSRVGVEGSGGSRGTTAHMQTYTIEYMVLKKQLQAVGEPKPELQIAAASFNADGRLLSSTLDTAIEPDTPAGKQAAQSSAYRMEIQLDAPENTRFLGFAVRDARTGQEGSLEIPLPLAPAA